MSKIHFMKGGFFDPIGQPGDLGWGYSYDATRRDRMYPPSLLLAKHWYAAGREFTKDAREFILAETARREAGRRAASSPLDRVVVEYSDLYPLQQQGVHWLLSVRKGLLTDELGVGKTAQALVAADLANGPTLFLTRGSLIEQVVEEATRWCKRLIPRPVYAGKDRRNIYQTAAKNDLIITNWEALSTFDVRMMGKQWHTFIGDEAHMVKNRKSQRSNRARLVAANSHNVFLLTATPLERLPSDLWHLAHLLRPNLYTSYWRWYNAFVDFYTLSTGIQIVKGVKNLPVLRDLLAPLQLRRERERTHVPQYIDIPVRLTGEQGNIYHELEEEEYLPKIDMTISNEAVRFMRLRQAASDVSQIAGRPVVSAKLVALKELLEGFPEDERVVIFTSFRKTAENAALLFPGRTHLYMGGSKHKTSPSTLLTQRPLLVTTYESLGAGANLQAAHIVVHIDLPWSSTLLKQALGRIDRVGQTKQPIYYNLFAPNTADVRVRDLLSDKADVFAEVVENSDKRLSVFT
jgi:SNF2 family DNA or RNA helicase